jgi:O-antigen ligase
MPSLLFGLCAFTIVCSVVLGGATQRGSLSDGILQYLALPLLLVAVWRLIDLRSAPTAKDRPLGRELLFCVAVVLVPLLQLAPLPPWLWSVLPGREPVASAFELLGREMSWMPLSVSPEATSIGALSLMVPIAIFLGCAQLSLRERRLISLVVLAVGVVSVFLGLLQVAQGSSSPLRFYAITNSEEAVGFFANRNHLAALLYSVMLITAAWTIETTFTAQADRARGVRDSAAIVAAVIGFAVLVIIVAAQAMARSRGGLGLTIVAIFGALALAGWDKRAMQASGRRGSFRLTPAKLVMGATAIGVIFAVQFALYRVMDRFTTDPLADARIPFARNTIAAAEAYMPFGSGVGTFVPVYGMFEKVQDTLANTYANRAHDDFLELWLETGVVGMVLIALFVGWLAFRAVKVWRRAPPGAREIDYSLARAATLIIALLMAHSVLDYPLRTEAMLAILAFACALLVAPSAHAAEARVAPTGSRKRTRPRATAQPVPTTAQPLAQPVPVAVARMPARSRRGSAAAPVPAVAPSALDGIEWPQEWLQPTAKASTGANRVTTTSPDASRGRAPSVPARDAAPPAMPNLWAAKSEKKIPNRERPRRS